MVVDGDGHIVEPNTLWTDYVSRAFRDRIYLERNAKGEAQRVVVGNAAFQVAAASEGFSSPGNSVTPGGYRDPKAPRKSWDEGDPGGFFAADRLRMHDAEGIDAAVLFPTILLCLANDITDQDVAAAAVRAVNDWAADFCKAAPGEFYGVAALPRQFPDFAAEELRRCVRDHGFVAAAIRPTPLADGRVINDPSMDVVWSEAEALDVPVTVHNVAFPNPRQAGEARFTTFLTRHSAAHPIEAMYALGGLLEARVFERFRQLRFGFMESGCGWAPFWTERLQEHAEMTGWSWNPPLTLDVMELFATRCVVGTEAEERMVGYVQQVLGDETVVWSSDFPHFDTHSPFVLPRPDLSESQRDGLYRRAALKFYRLDEDRIARANAARRGANRGAQARADGVAP